MDVELGADVSAVREYRSIRELRSADCNKIEGYAVVFNSESQWFENI